MPNLQDLYKTKEVSLFRQLLLKQDQEKIWKNYQELNQLAEKGGTVFAGDSITEFFPIHELLRSSKRLYNRGVHGIDSLDLLAHLDSHILDLKPEKIFLLIGINDLKNRSPRESLETIEQIINQVHTDLPHSQLHLLSVLPINESHLFRHSPSRRSNQAVLELNDGLRQLPVPTFLDLHDQFCDDRGQLKKEWTLDGIHLTISAYQILSQALQAFL